MSKCTGQTKLNLENIYHHYQPLWDFKGWTIYGYEAFIRSDIFNPEELFTVAKRENRLYELDILSIKKAVEKFTGLGHFTLFVNIYPSTIVHKDFRSFFTSLLDVHPSMIQRLVIELNETIVEQELWESYELKERISWLRELGVFIALDDVGNGATTLQKIIDYKPDFIKLDRFFAKKLADSLEKQHMLSFFVSYSNRFKSHLILEGIETTGDLTVAKELKVQMGQGYLLGRPNPIELVKDERETYETKIRNEN